MTMPGLAARFVTVSAMLCGLAACAQEQPQSAVAAGVAADSDAGPHMPSGDQQVTAAVTNLFDKFTYLNKFRGPAISSVTGQSAAPRQWSISVRKSF